MEKKKIVSTANMTVNQEYECSDSEDDDPFLKIIKKYQNRPTIKLIKAKNKNITKFQFQRN